MIRPPDPPHIRIGCGRWTACAYREGRAYWGHGPTREAASAACDEALALDGWPPGPGPRWGVEPRPHSQGAQVEQPELAQVTR